MTGFKLSDERYEEIKEIIVDMFETYHVSCVPISGFEIATRMGIKVVPYSALEKRIRRLILKKGEDGVTGLNCGEYTIYYNDKLSTERYYGSDGKPYLDIDYSNHGNAKMHPHVPHEHKITFKDGKMNRAKSDGRIK